MKAILSVVQVGSVFASVGLLLLMMTRMRRAKERQNRLVNALKPEAGETWFRVILSRPAHFAKRWKLIGYEARGLLINSPDRVRIVAEIQNGEKLDTTYCKDSMGLQWIGNNGIASTNLHWFSIGQNDQRLMLSADTGMNAITSREATADICRIAAPDLQLPDIAQKDFALEKNTASLTALVLFFSLMIFGFVDGLVLNKNELLEIGYVGWGAPIIAMLAIPAYLWMSTHEVPSREALTLSVLLGFTLSGVYVPAIKRADQLLSPQGSVSTAFRLEAHAVLQPVVAGPPQINDSRQREYWAQFAVGSIHDFKLIHGPLGLWQLDRTTLDKDMRRFYERKEQRHKKP